MAEELTEFDPEAVPCPRPEVTVADMPLSAAEGYVFSRMDGVMSVGELVSACGLSDEEGDRVLSKLVELGAIDVLKLVSDDDDAGGDVAGPKDLLENEGEDVSEEFRARITSMLELSEEGNFYELIGVPPDSEKGDIRKAYFDLSKEFHPDTYYGKDLGRYRHMMETVFGRLTDAYETLSRKKKRLRYDEYIADQIKAWEMEKRLAQVPSLVLYRPKAEPATVDEAASDGPAAAGAAGSAASTPAPAQAPTPAAQLGPESAVHQRLREQKKKRALSALLKVTGAGKKKKKKKKGPAPKKFVPTSPEQQLALQYAVAGADALERTEYMTALNNFELALQITPDDRKIQEMVERARGEAGAALSKTFEKQGAFEEELGQHVRAAQSFLKALDVQQHNHVLMDRAASNLLQGGGNLTRAEELAKQALELEPNNVDYRATLGEILRNRGDKAGAASLLREASRLDPGNERVARLLGEL